MSYVMNAPAYEAKQWDGSNAAECQAFHLQWFPQPPPAPPWQDPPPPAPFIYDQEGQTLTIYPGETLNIGDWMVNGGSWSPGSAWAGAPEVVSDVVFQEKYAQGGP